MATIYYLGKTGITTLRKCGMEIEHRAQARYIGGLDVTDHQQCVGVTH
jgi:hypothetical protein